MVLLFQMSSCCRYIQSLSFEAYFYHLLFLQIQLGSTKRNRSFDISQICLN